MDVMMPGLDGPSTFKRMRESALLAQIPVIFMTAKVLPAEISQFLRLGAIGVIVKPFDPLELYGDLVALWSKGGAAVHAGSPEPGSESQARAQAQAQAHVDSLTINFLRRASADVISVAKLIAQAQDGDRSALKEIERVSHSIHGAGAMFGFPRMSEVSGTMTRIAERLTASAAPAGDAALSQQLLECSKHLAREVDAAWQTAPQGGAMFQGPVAAR
jgi:CheY-like chemotaxis protein